MFVGSDPHLSSKPILRCSSPSRCFAPLPRSSRSPRSRPRSSPKPTPPGSATQPFRPTARPWHSPTKAISTACLRPAAQPCSSPSTQHRTCCRSGARTGRSSSSRATATGTSISSSSPPPAVRRAASRSTRPTSFPTASRPTASRWCSAPRAVMPPPTGSIPPARSPSSTRCRSPVDVHCSSSRRPRRTPATARMGASWSITTARVARTNGASITPRRSRATSGSWMCGRGRTAR